MVWGIWECGAVQTVSEMSTCKPELQHFFSFTIASGTMAEIAYTYSMLRRNRACSTPWYWVWTAFNAVGAIILVTKSYKDNETWHRAGAFIKFLGSFAMAAILYRARRRKRAFACLVIAALAAVIVGSAAYSQSTPYADSESYAEFVLIYSLHAALIFMYAHDTEPKAPCEPPSTGGGLKMAPGHPPSRLLF